MATTAAGHSRVNWGLFGLIVAAVIAGLALWTILIQPALVKGGEVMGDTGKNLQEGAAEIKDDFSEASARNELEEFVPDYQLKVLNTIFPESSFKDVKVVDIQGISWDEAYAKAKIHTPNPLIPGYNEDGNTYYHYSVIAGYTSSGQYLESDQVYTVYKKPGEDWVIVPAVRVF